MALPMGGALRGWRRELTVALVLCTALLVAWGLAPARAHASTIITFTGAFDADWSSPVNWDLARSPVPGDRVLIPADKAVALTEAMASIDSIECYGTLVLTSGSLTLLNPEPSIIKSLTLSGSDLNLGGGSLDITGFYTADALSHLSNGVVSIGPAASAGIVGGGPTSLTLSNIQMFNTGSLTVQGGSLDMANGSSIINLNLMYFSADVGMEHAVTCSAGAPGHIANDSTGWFGKMGPGTWDFTFANLSNSGSAMLAGGTLRVPGGWTPFGSMTIEPGSVLEVMGEYLEMGGADIHFGVQGSTPGVDYGQIHVVGQATFGSNYFFEGRLGYVPSLGTTFTPVTYGSYTFGAPMLASTWATYTLIPQFNPTDLTLFVTDGDHTPPSVEATGVPVGWATTPVNIVFNRSDNMPGPVEVYYTNSRVGTDTVLMASGSVGVFDEGITTIRYWAVDLAGNSSETQTVEVKTDYYNPYTWWPAAYPTFNGTATIELMPEDSGSGIAHTWYQVDGSGWITYTAPVEVTGLGAHAIDYYSTDVSGRTEGFVTSNFQIIVGDATPPVSAWNQINMWADAARAYYNTNSSIELTATDDGPGPVTTYYQFNFGTVETYTAPIPMTDPGLTFVTFWSVDASGNVEPSVTYSLGFDDQPPTSTCTTYLVGPDLHATLDTYDIGASARELFFRIDSDPYTSVMWPYSIDLSILPGGTHTLSWYAEDYLGNAETPKTYTFTSADASSPVTTVMLTPSTPTGQSGWYVNPVSVDLFANEPATKYYQWNAQNPAAWQIAYTMFPAYEGLNTLNYFSVDSAGNTETVNSATIMVDTVTPTNPAFTGSSHVTGTPSAVPVVNVAWTGAGDASSGVAGYSIAWDNAPATLPDMTTDAPVGTLSTNSPALTPGDWYVHLRTTDVAGNWSPAVHSGPFRIIAAPPGLTGTMTLDAGAAWATGPTVSIGSSVPGATQMRYSWDAGTWSGWQTYSSALAVPVPGPDGVRMIAVEYADGLGSSLILNDGIVRDTTGPQAPMPKSLTHVAGGWSKNTAFTADWQGGFDAYTGVAGYSFSLTHGAADPDTVVDVQTTLTSNLTDASDWYLNVRAVDGAGNWGPTTSFGPVRIDTVVPVVNITNPQAVGYYLGSTITPQWTATDAHSGISTAVGTSPSGSPLTLNSGGAKSYTVSATDRAGNAMTMIVHYRVVYRFGGFQYPLSSASTALAVYGRPARIAFKLTDEDGTPVTTARNKVYFAKIVAGRMGAEKPAVWADGRSGNVLAWDATNARYYLNARTLSLSPGTWRVRVLLGDGTSRTTTLRLVRIKVVMR